MKLSLIMEKIKQMLESSDKGIVELGLLLLKEKKRKRYWKEFLDTCKLQFSINIYWKTGHMTIANTEYYFSNWYYDTNTGIVTTQHVVTIIRNEKVIDTYKKEHEKYLSRNYKSKL